MRRGCRAGEPARRVGVEEAVCVRPPMGVLRVSREWRCEDEAGECAREEAIDGRGEERVDMLVYGGG